MTRSRVFTTRKAEVFEFTQKSAHSEEMGVQALFSFPENESIFACRIDDRGTSMLSHVGEEERRPK